jgi:hypothetical protein
MSLTTTVEPTLLYGSPVLGLRAAPPQTITALPAPVNLELYKGDDFYLDLIVTNPDGTDADLSTATPSAQIRTAANSPAVLAAFDATVEGNIVHLHLPNAEAAKLTSARCAWDAQIDTGDITTLVAGMVTVSGEVTLP